MPEKYVINVDLAKLTYHNPKTEEEETRLLGWGDTVEIEDPERDITDTEIKVKLSVFENFEDNSVGSIPVTGVIKNKRRTRGGQQIVIKKSESKVLKIDFVDVQQGDGIVIETPEGKKILIDGGDNQLFARYLANRFRNSSETEPCFVDCILVTHGDADHFLGLTRIYESETNQTPRKRLFLCPERVYHNGLVKRPGKVNNRKVPDKNMLGATVSMIDPETNKNVVVITELEENLLDVDDEKMNEPFKKWKNVLGVYQSRLQARKNKDIAFRRLEFGMSDAFDFLDAGITARVLAPILTESDGARGLKFLRNPPKGPRTAHETLDTNDDNFSKTLSASHTINGHSVVLQLRYGGFTFMFSGDLNDEAERILTRAHNRNQLSLLSDVLKVPHHGSHDFSGAFMKAVQPIISVVSSGDESARKEYIHPRANLVGALGRFSRVEEPLIFITELVAFFQTEGWIREKFHQLTDEGKTADKSQDVVNPEKKDFYAFSRAAFGLVMIRTDGKRLLVYTNSALSDMKEAYAFQMDEFDNPLPSEVIKL